MDGMTAPAAPDPSAPALDLRGDLLALARAVIDIESVSGNERALADAVEHALREQAPHLTVERDGDTVVARTDLGRERRAVFAGHLDTVPVAANLPSRLRTVDGVEQLWGRGAADMKGGVAVLLQLAALAADPAMDLTFLFYDHEEVEAELNSLTRLARTHPEWLQGDVAVIGEPTGAAIEAGCKGTMKIEVTAHGRAAHSARDWVGDNAVHKLGPVLQRLAAYEARTAVIDGLEFRECLNAVTIQGGIAGNVIPDRAQALLNYRFAPDTTPEQAEAHVREILDGCDVDIAVVDSAAGALPGLESPVLRGLLDVLGEDIRIAGKQGWTDVARFTALGIPAVNFGPGDPLQCHTDDEHIAVADLAIVRDALCRWLEIDPVVSDHA